MWYCLWHDLKPWPETVTRPTLPLFFIRTTDGCDLTVTSTPPSFVFQCFSRILKWIRFTIFRLISSATLTYHHLFPSSVMSETPSLRDTTPLGSFSCLDSRSLGPRLVPSVTYSDLFASRGLVSPGPSDTVPKIRSKFLFPLSLIWQIWNTHINIHTSRSDVFLSYASYCYLGPTTPKQDNLLQAQSDVSSPVVSVPSIWNFLFSNLFLYWL